MILGRLFSKQGVSSQINGSIRHQSIYFLVGNTVVKLFLTICTGCPRMATVPQAAFAVNKVRKNLEHWQYGDDETKFEKASAKMPKVSDTAMGQLPFQYSSKLMNSIWGLYNRYSVHNLKKNQDGGIFAGNMGF